MNMLILNLERDPRFPEILERNALALAEGNRLRDEAGKNRINPASLIALDFLLACDDLDENGIEATLTDKLTNAMHTADMIGADFDDLCRRARSHYLAEIEGNRDLHVVETPVVIRPASPADLIDWNGLSEDEHLRHVIEDNGVTCFVVSPVREERSGEPHMEVCSPEEATMWSIYYRKADGETMLLHDCEGDDRAEDAANRLVELEAATGLPLTYIDPMRSCWDATSCRLCEFLSEEIIAEIPAYDNIEDFPEEAWDAHPFAPLHQALSEIAPDYSQAGRPKQ